MRYDPATRVLSLSFTRDPEEHIDVMLETGRRMATPVDPVSAWTGFGVAIGFGAVVGVVMEMHRRFILPLILGPAEVAPLSTVAAQLLPLILLVVALYVAIYRHSAKRQRKAMMSRLEPDVMVDVDIFTQGIVSSSGDFTVEIDWFVVTDIILDGSRIEIECESFAIYLPERAFADRAAFIEAAKELRELWRAAMKRGRDSRMAEAGPD